ncbi:hypothetical protein [Pedobacter sp. NJ-S-72]
MFEGVFGSSDEILGAIGNGVDFEKRIAQIYQNCRTTKTIKQAFDDLQRELQPEISEKIQAVRTTLLENFDEEVKEKLRVNFAETKANLNRFEQKLWDTTQFYLNDNATFNSDDFSFSLNQNPFPDENIHQGPYMILRPEEGKRKSDIYVPDDTNIYRIGHKLAKRILKACKEQNTPVKEVVFDYSNTPTKITLLQNLIGQSGWLQVQTLSINSFEQEDYLLLSCFTENGELIDRKTAARFFSIDAKEGGTVSIPIKIEDTFKELIFKEKQGVLSENANRNRDFFDVEMDKLDQWADDMKISLDREIKDLDAEN